MKIKLSRENVNKFSPKKMGIYKIKCLRNGKVYIGQSVNISKRLIEHIRELEKGTHNNQKMQSSYNQYGENSFIFEVLEIIDDKKYLTIREKYWASEFDSFNNKKGFNLCPITSCDKFYKKEFAELVMGSKNGNSKLKEENVIDICLLLKEKELNYTEIGRKYGVSSTAISSIANGRTWKNLSSKYLGISS